MPDSWMPGLRHDPGRGAGYPVSRTRMEMCVHHDTGGTNSYNVCKWGRPGYATSLCQILLPEDGVPWQFCEIDSLCYHAGNPIQGDYNDNGPGIEVERFHDDPLTEDQAFWLGEINAWLATEWGIPNTQYRGPHFPNWGAEGYRGHVNHSDIHSNPDGLTYEEWDRISAPPPAPALGDDMPFIAWDHEKKRTYEFVGNVAVIGHPPTPTGAFGIPQSALDREVETQKLVRVIAYPSWAMDTMLAASKAAGGLG